MESENAVIEKFHKLFIKYFIKNSLIDEEDISSEEILTLDCLKPLEVYLNFKDLIEQLTDFKEKIIKTEKAQMVVQNEQYGKLLQKLEADIRNSHAREQNLKILVDSSTAKIEELKNKLKEGKNTVKGLENTILERDNKLEKLSMQKESSYLESKLSEIENKFKTEIQKAIENHISFKNQSTEALKTFDGNSKLNFPHMKTKLKADGKSIFNEKSEAEILKTETKPRFKIKTLKKSPSRNQKFVVECKQISLKALRSSKRNNFKDSIRISARNLRRDSEINSLTERDLGKKQKQSLDPKVRSSLRFESGPVHTSSSPSYHGKSINLDN